MKVIVIWPDEDLPAAKILINPRTKRREDVTWAMRRTRDMLAKRGLELQYGWRRNLSDTFFETVATIKGD